MADRRHLARRARSQLRALWRNAVRRPGPDPDYADGDDAVWLAVDWRAALRRVAVEGATLNVLDTGRADGPALVFLHGLSGNWQNWLYSIPAFTATHRVIAPDLPGFGASPLPDGAVSIERYARMIDALLARLDVGRATVVGNSMGGFIAAELAIRHAARVERLVLVSAAGLSIEHVRTRPTLAIARRIGRDTSSNLLIVRRRRTRRAALQGVFRYPEQISPRMVWEMNQGSAKPGYLPALEAMLEYPIRARLASIAAPTLIVWGENDLQVPVSDAYRFERLIGPRAHAVVFEETGHVPMIERPGRFNRLLADWLAADPAPERRVEGVARS